MYRRCPLRRKGWRLPIQQRCNRLDTHRRWRGKFLDNAFYVVYYFQANYEIINFGFHKRWCLVSVHCWYLRSVGQQLRRSLPCESMKPLCICFYSVRKLLFVS